MRERSGDRDDNGNAGEPAHIAPLIRLVNGRAEVVADDWRLLGIGVAADPVHAEAIDHRPVVLPAAQVLAQPALLDAHPPSARIGLWLAPTDDPAAVVPLFERVELLAVHFPKFTDGRGYSTAYLLRSRYGWRGELRAIGEVLQDQLFYMKRVGFDSFALRADRDPYEALRAFGDFSASYQGSITPARPHFLPVAVNR